MNKILLLVIRILLISGILLESFFLLSLLFPYFFGTGYFYFDLASGQEKIVFISFGYTHSEKYRETPFSELVRKLELTTPRREWRLYIYEDVGLRSLFTHKRREIMKMCTLVVRSRAFLDALEVCHFSFDVEKQKTREFLQLLKEEKSDELVPFMKSLCP